MVQEPTADRDQIKKCRCTALTSTCGRDAIQPRFLRYARTTCDGASAYGNPQEKYVESSDTFGLVGDRGHACPIMVLIGVRDLELIFRVTHQNPQGNEAFGCGFHGRVSSSASCEIGFANRSLSLNYFPW